MAITRAVYSHCVGRQNTNDRGGATDGQCLNCLADQRGAAHSFEGVVDTRTCSHGADRFDGIVIAAVDNMGCTDTPG